MSEVYVKDNMKMMDTICVMCPMGCNIHIEQNGDNLTVTGNTCKRGEVYGKAEFTTPIRMVTSLVRYKDKVASVRTSQPIAKTAIFSVLKEIKKIKV
ncbi:MAG: DUF1667 domain-containing protein, partial [Clostridia bacterium]